MRRSRPWLLPLLLLGLLFLLIVRAILLEAITPHYKDVDLKALGFFPLDAANGITESIPARWRSLDGQRVRLEGFMYDPNAASPTTQNFQFVYNFQNSWGPPRVQERIFATATGGPVPLYSDLVQVEGVLHVGVVNPTGNQVESVYRINVEHVGPALTNGPEKVIPAVILILGLLCVPPAIVVLSIRAWNRRKRLRSRQRLCPVCGYDLRASGNRCPECGSLVEMVSSITLSDGVT